MNYESTLTRDDKGYCKLFGLEFKTGKSRRWQKCSLTMRDRDALRVQAELLTKQEGWSCWRTVEIT